MNSEEAMSKLVVWEKFSPCELLRTWVCDIDKGH